MASIQQREIAPSSAFFQLAEKISEQFHLGLLDQGQLLDLVVSSGSGRIVVADVVTLVMSTRPYRPEPLLLTTRVELGFRCRQVDQIVPLPFAVERAAGPAAYVVLDHRRGRHLARLLYPRRPG